MPVKQKSVELTKEEFIAALKQARDKAGSTFKLSLAIGVHPRRIMYWMAGDGSTVKKMIIVYEQLKALPPF